MKPDMLSIDALRDAVARLPDDRLMPMRRAALEQLGAQGLPTPRDEDWKYTNIAPFVDVRADAPAAGDIDAVIQQVKQSIDADWLVIANGKAELQHIPGADLALLSDAQVSLDSPFALTQLNTALLHDGIQIRIASDVASKFVNVVDPLCLHFACGCPTDALAEWNVHAGGKPLKRAKHQFIFSLDVNTKPVDVGNFCEQQADEVCTDGEQIGFVVSQRRKLSGE